MHRTVYPYNMYPLRKWNNQNIVPKMALKPIKTDYYFSRKTTPQQLHVSVFYVMHFVIVYYFLVKRKGKFQDRADPSSVTV